MIKILTKLHAIMSEVESIEKDGHNDFHNYDYATERAIKVAVRDLLIKHNVLFNLSVTSISREGEITTIESNYLFYDIDSGESLSGIWESQGQDKGDKGVYKAVTGAIKYIFTTQFVIPTGDDPEKDKANDIPTDQDNPNLKWIDDESPAAITYEPEMKECPIHPTMQMTRKDGKYGTFYSHKLPNGAWCSGKSR